MDFSFLFDDEEEYNNQVVPPPKRPKNDGFIMTLDEAIEAEMRAIKTAKAPCGVTVREIREHAELIRKFIGDYSRFEPYIEREIKQVEDFFEERISKCYQIRTDEPREVELRSEEVSWININYDTVVRIFYRTQGTVLLDSKVWFGKSFLDISVELHAKAKREAFLKRVAVHLSVPDHMAGKKVKLTDNERDKIVHFIRKKAVALGLAPQQFDCNIDVDCVDDLCTFVASMNSEENGRNIHDDRKPIEVRREVLPLKTYQIKAEVEEDAFFEVQVSKSTRVTEEEHFEKGMSLSVCDHYLMFPTRGRYYSDRNVAKMSVGERIAYSQIYDQLTSKKKTVSFSDTPECLVIFCKHLKSFVDEHKKNNGFTNRVYYPRQNTRFYVGERTTTAIGISYNQYRIMCWGPKDPLGVAQPSTAFTTIARKDTKLRCFKDKIYNSADQDVNGCVVPAHRYLVYPFVVPFIDQNRLLEDHCNNLIRYSVFWRPNERSMPCSYNHSYGLMIISDSILEDVNPCAVSNAGIFQFPYPLDKLAVLGILDELTPDQFFVRDIVFVWGFDKMMEGESSEKAVADLLTLYELVKIKMFSKYEKFKSQGYSRLFIPRFWLSTVPVTPALNMENFNHYIRAFVSYSSTMESIHSRVGLIDWDQVCEKNACTVSCESAEIQLELLYKELEKKVDLVRRRDNDAKRKDTEQQLTRTNQLEWLERNYE